LNLATNTHREDPSNKLNVVLLCRMSHSAAIMSSKDFTIKYAFFLKQEKISR